MNKDKILAIDFGRRHVGLASCDVNFGVIFCKGEISGGNSLKAVFEAIAKKVREEDAGIVVFGIPAVFDDGDLAQVKKMKQIGKKLGEFLGENLPGVKVEFQDESFSSFEARAVMKEANGVGFAGKHSEHEVAAMIILKKFLKKKGLGNE